MYIVDRKPVTSVSRTSTSIIGESPNQEGVGEHTKVDSHEWLNLTREWGWVKFLEVTVDKSRLVLMFELTSEDFGEVYIQWQSLRQTLITNGEFPASMRQGVDELVFSSRNTKVAWFSGNYGLILAIQEDNYLVLNSEVTKFLAQKSSGGPAWLSE